MTRLLLAGVSVAALAFSQDVESIASLIQNGKFAEAKESARARLGTDSPPDEQARFLYLAGVARKGLGEFAEARTALTSAAAMCEQLRNEEALLSEILVSLGSTEVELGAGAAAERALLRARRLMDQLGAPDHPFHSTIANELGYVYWNIGQLTKAEGEYERAVALGERVFGKDSPLTGQNLSSLGAFLAGTGRGAEAIPLLEECIPILRRHFGATHHETIRAIHGLAVAKTKDDPRGAEALLRSALKEWLSAYPEVHPSAVYLLQAIGECRMEQKDPREAAALTKRAIEISRQFYGPQHPKFVGLLRDQLRYLVAAKQRREAASIRKEIERAVSAPGYTEPGRHSVDVRALRR